MSFSVGQRCGSELVLLWLWCWPADVALIQPLAQEVPYASGATLKRKKKSPETLHSRTVIPFSSHHKTSSVTIYWAIPTVSNSRARKMSLSRMWFQSPSNFFKGQCHKILLLRPQQFLGIPSVFAFLYSASMEN